MFIIVGPLATVGILAVAKGSPLSTPKQGITEQNSDQSGGVQTKPQDSNDAAQNPPPPLAVHQPYAPTCDEICQQGRQNLDIQGKLKTFTGWLVVVGIVQAFALAGTVVVAIRQERIIDRARDEIHTQAGHMSRQADLMSRSNVITLATARAAKESAKAANAQIKIMKDKERARIMVNVIRLETLTFGDNGNQIIMRFENTGPTQAQNVRANGTARVIIKDFDPSDLEPFDVGPQEIAPQDVIRANQPPLETYLVFFIPEKWGDDLVFMERRILIEMRGSVEYEDIFGDRHTTPLNYDMRIPKIVKWRGNSVAEVPPMGQWREVVGADGNRAT
jgi:hypothetical protein